MQRKTIRRDLGLRRIGSFLVSSTAVQGSINLGLVVIDPAQANSDLANQNVWQGAYLRAGSADYRVGSFNTGSGAFLSAQVVRSTIPSGGDFEVSQKISSADMDRYIDETIALMRKRQDVAFPTVEGQTRYYNINTVASPHAIISVLNAYYYADPSSTTNPQRHDFTQEQVVFTATGMELRLPGGQGLGASMQIVLDAMLQMTLGASDDATVNLIDEETILWGAAARVYDHLMQDSPGQEFKNYQALNQRAVLQYNRLAASSIPQVDHKIGFDSPFEFTGRRGGGPLDDWG